MNQVLHIFQKDARRHWPEILISWILLGLYTRWAIHPWNGAMGITSFAQFFLRAEIITPVLVLSWSFLILRIVYGESLIGDRQWWVTKPYLWWKLLDAKVLFVLAFIGLPLFLVQAYLLRYLGFPLLPNLRGILGMQFALAIVLALPSMALGTLTKGMGQALFGAVATLIAFIGIFALIQEVPSGEMASAAGAVESTQAFLVLGSILAVVLWQYARRKTWPARGVLLGSFAAVTLLGVLTPYAKFVEKKFPAVEAREAPAQFAFLPFNAAKGKLRTAPQFATKTFLRIPLAVYGIAVGTVVQVDGINVTVVTSDGASWNPGWKSTWTTIWPEDDRENFIYEVKRKDYEKFQNATGQLRVELALTEFHETDVRDLILKDGNFSEPALGICHLNPANPAAIQCLNPFRPPGLMATFNPAQAKCAYEGTDGQFPENRIAHAWLPPTKDDSSNPGINPVADYEVSFRSKVVWTTSSEDGSNRKLRVLRLCPEAPLRLARPEEKRHVRVQLEMNGVSLRDLEGNQFDWE
jgi:hypothetical protein